MTTPNEWLNEFQVNTGAAATGTQLNPKIMGLANGGFVVAWEELTTGSIGTAAGYDIVAKIYDAQGNVVRDSYQLNSGFFADDERDFDLTATHDGFAIAFIDDSIGLVNQTSVIYQRYNLFGSAIQTLTIANENVVSDFLANPQIAANLIAANDDVFVAFNDRVGADEDISARVVNEAGVLGAEFGAAQNSTDFDRLGDAAVLSNGNFVTVYEEADGATTSLEFAIRTAAGTTVVNSSSIGVGRNVSVSGLANGNFVVTYNDEGFGDVFARVFTSGGGAVGGVIFVATGTNSQNEPVVVALRDGDFVVLWDDDTTGAVFGRRLNPDGTADGTQFTVDIGFALTEIDVSTTADGRILFAARADGGEIVASIWDPRPATIDPDDYGTATANFLGTDVITTNVTGSTVVAGDKGDTVLGQGGNDTIFSSGDGTFLGGAGDDQIHGSDSTTNTEFEFLDGGAGIRDYLVINNMAANWGVNLATGAVTLDGAAFTRASYVNFEFVATGIGNNNVIGTSGANFIDTSSGNDTVVSGAGNDTVNGGSGNDLIDARGGGTNQVSGGNDNDTIFSSGAGTYRGEAGNDTIYTGVGTSETLDGGTGIDTLITTSSGVNYNINLITGVTNFAPESFINFENITTGIGNDTITGTTGANVINSGTGDDFVVSGNGNDTVFAQSGTNFVSGGNNDDLIYSSGLGTYRGDAGDDRIVAGTGTAETLDGGTGVDTLFNNGTSANYNINLATGVTNFAAERFFNFENVYTGTGNDTVIGTSGANLIVTGNGNDLINSTSGGSDTVIAGNGDDWIFSSGIGSYRGDAGDDQIVAGAVGVGETLDGGTGVDILFTTTSSANYVVNLATGATNVAGESFINFESVYTGIGNDRVDGTNGANLIDTSSGNDTIVSGLGNDTINASNGNDLIVANAGGTNDVRGGNDDDTIFSSGAGVYRGDAGNDELIAGGVGTVETLDGGAGVDTLRNTESNADYVVNLVTGATNFAGESFINFENVYTGAGNDNVVGTSGANLIVTGNGNDTINPGAGNDTVNSGDGDDRIEATVGINSVSAGSDNDLIFTSGFGIYNGDAGDDQFVSAVGTSETLDGGTGIDDLFNTATGASYSINMVTGVTNFALERFFNFENLFSGSGNDTIIGTGGANRIEANDGNDVVLSGDGNDFVSGGTGNDTIDAGSGADTVFAGDGDDVVNSANNGSDNEVYGGNGNDVIQSSGRGEYYGEAGDDRLIVAVGLNETLDGGTGNDTLDASGAAFDYEINLTTGLTNFVGEIHTNFENVLSGTGDDELRGTLGANLMDGGDGNDRILAFAGNDTLVGGLGEDTLNGGDGDDSIEGGAGNDKVFAEAGNDSIDGGAGDDLLEGKIGDDTIRGDVGNDTLRGSDGQDNINGGEGNDVAFGGNDNDTLFGDLGDDTLDGSSGDDFIDGWIGNDVLVGETGNDNILGYDGNDTMRGGGGNDTMSGENDDDLMFGSAGEDRMFGGNGNDTMSGDTQADQLFGGAGDDILRGGDGFDFLEGDDGNDILAGGNGNDTLNGGAGQDTLRGNAQNDTYVFSDESHSTILASDLIDNIQGVGAAGGDIIDLSAIDANTLIGGDQAFTFLGFQSTLAGLGFGAGGLWVENSGNQTLLYGNTDGGNDIEFAVRINDGAGITASDYFLGDFIV